MILNAYTIEDYSISEVYLYKMQYLPRSFVKSVLELYKDKTELKDTGNDGEYNHIKAMVNSSFGMVVQDPVQEDFIWNSEESSSERVELTLETIEDKITQVNNAPQRFIFYLWGLYITAYARKNLFETITYLQKDFIYADTDSVYYKNPEKHKQHFNKRNLEIIEKNRKSTRNATYRS